MTTKIMAPCTGEKCPLKDKVENFDITFCGKYHGSRCLYYTPVEDSQKNADENANENQIY